MAVAAGLRPVSWILLDRRAQDGVRVLVPRARRGRAAIGVGGDLNCGGGLIGDPQRIMVFGVSAGGAAVAHLLTTAPPGLIFAAAMESPGGHQGWMAPGSRPDDDFVAPSVLAAASSATAAAVGCALDDLICLRKVPNSDIITAAEGVRFAPALLRARPANPLSADGVETPLALLRLGAWQQGAVIIGGQSCESCAATMALAGPPRNLTHFEFVDALQTYFAGSRIAWSDVVERYTERVATEGRWRTLARIMSDSGHACSAQLHASAVADGWVYEFEKATKGLPGAVHGSDEPWLFQEKDSPLAAAMAPESLSATPVAALALPPATAWSATAWSAGARTSPRH